MSGYVLCTSACICCGRIFSYNPHKVPSTKVFTDSREPVCGPCIAEVNAKRRARGLEPFKIHPEAYEPLPENEL